MGQKGLKSTLSKTPRLILRNFGALFGSVFSSIVVSTVKSSLYVATGENEHYRELVNCLQLSDSNWRYTWSYGVALSVMGGEKNLHA